MDVISRYVWNLGWKGVWGDCKGDRCEKGDPPQSAVETKQETKQWMEMAEQPATGTLEQLRQELEAAEAAVAAFGPSPEQLREEAAKAEQLAKESGTPAKSAAVIRQLERRWREFLDAHGEAYGYEEAAGPTIELAVHFQVRDGARGRVCWWEGAMRQVVSRAAWAAGRGWARGWA